MLLIVLAVKKTPCFNGKDGIKIKTFSIEDSESKKP